MSGNINKGDVNRMRKPDLTYTDILPRDLSLYINQDDEECHKLEAVSTNGEPRFDILIWLKEDN